MESNKPFDLNALSALMTLDFNICEIANLESDIKELIDKINIPAMLLTGNYNGPQNGQKEGHVSNEETTHYDTWMSLACASGCYELVQFLLAMHANIEDRGTMNGCTPLMEAASAGCEEIVKLLLYKGAVVNESCSKDNTPLMYASAGGHVNIVKELLSKGATIENANKTGHTALMEAANAGHIMVAKVLIEHGAIVYIQSSEDTPSALTLACVKSNLEMIRFLLEAETNQKNKVYDMHTALMEASQQGHIKMAKLLLDFGAEVNMIDDDFETPLTLAVSGGHVTLALLLIEKGANIDEPSFDELTPLMVALQDSHKDMVYALLKNGASLSEFTDVSQDTSLSLECKDGLLELTDFLLEHYNILLNENTTFLIEAALVGNLKVARYLLECGANVNATTTPTNDTALTYACKNGHTDLADLLIQFGANIHHRSDSGSPLTNAARKSHMSTVMMLLSKEAKVDY